MRNRKLIYLICCPYMYILSISMTSYRIVGVMVSVLASSEVDSWFEPRSGQTYKTITFVFVASPISTQHQGARTKTGWHRIRIMCPSGATCLHSDFCVSELAL
jgi:hypothetical protein